MAIQTDRSDELLTTNSGGGQGEAGVFELVQKLVAHDGACGQHALAQVAEGVLEAVQETGLGAGQQAAQEDCVEDLHLDQKQRTTVTLLCSV